MPPCLFCKRDDLPRVPLFPYGIGALVAHVDPRGAPCLEGTSQETHSQMLGPDYPRDLLNDDAVWDLSSGEPMLALTAQPADPVEALERIRAIEIAEEPAPLPDVEPPTPPARPPRRPRARKATP